MNVADRIEIEKKIVRHLCDTMAKHGWIAKSVDDGGDEWEPVKSTNEVVEAVFAVDEAHIVFKKTDGDKTTRCAVFIVLGNSGWDCIADYSYTTEFLKIMEEEVDPFCYEIEEEINQ